MVYSIDESDLHQHMNINRKKKLRKKGKKGKFSKSSVKFGRHGSRVSIVNSSSRGQKLKSKNSKSLLGFNIRPKFKKARSVAKGSISILLNVENKKKRDFMNFHHDLDEEILKLKVSMRKEIPYEQLNMGENQQRLLKLSANNKLRMKMVKNLLRHNKDLIKKLKLHSQILSNWISYVGYLSKLEFFKALRTIGVKFDKELFNSIFWLYDLNGDGLVDDKEFWLINSLFRGRSIVDKVKSKFTPSFLFLTFECS